MLSYIYPDYRKYIAYKCLGRQKVVLVIKKVK